MADTPAWKKIFQESNALGWIALFAVIAVIGIGTLLFGGAPQKHPANPATTQAGATK